MRLQTKLASSLLVAVAVAVPSVVRAEDDNVKDGKSYPGSMCDSMVSSTLSARTGNFYANTSGSATNAICPIIQDSWTQTGGLSYGRIHISNVAGQTFSCTQSSYDAWGGLLSSRSISTTTGGINTYYFFSGTYLPTTGNNGYITITCTVPHAGQIRGYQVEEKA